MFWVTRWFERKLARKQTPKKPAKQFKARSTVRLSAEELEVRVVPASVMLGQQLFPADYPTNAPITNAPVNTTLTAYLQANVFNTVKGVKVGVPLKADTGPDNPTSSSPLYGIPYNVVHSSDTVNYAMTKVYIDSYPGTDISGTDSNGEYILAPLPKNGQLMIEGDNQNGPNPTPSGDSHLLVWDADTDKYYQFWETTRPNADLSNISYGNTPVAGAYNAGSGAIFNMSGDNFRPIGDDSGEAAGLAILSDLPRPDEVLPAADLPAGVAAPMAIDHAIRVTFGNNIIQGKYVFPASHTAGETGQLPLGTRLRLIDDNGGPIDQQIAIWGDSTKPATYNPQSYALAIAMQTYGLIIADGGSNMFFQTAPTSVGTNGLPMIDPLTGKPVQWNINALQSGIQSITSADFQVVDLSPKVTSLSTTSGSAGTQITITGQNFLGAAGHLQVLFSPAGLTPLWTQTGTNGQDRITTLKPTVFQGTSVTVIDSTHLSVIVPSGLSGTVDVHVLSGQLLDDNLTTGGDAANTTAPIFGYGISTALSFTYSSVTVSGTNSTVSLGSPTVAAGLTDTVTIVVKDTSNAAVTGLTSGNFGFGLSGGTSTGSFGTFTATATPGTYTEVFTGALAGTASTLTVTVNGVTITTMPTITVTVGGVSQGNSTVSFASSSVASGSPDTVTIVVKDPGGNAITGLLNAAFSFGLSIGTSAGTFGAVTASATPGTYTATFTGTTAGTASTLTATISGTALTTKPTVTVTPGTVSAANSTVSFATSSVASGGTDTVTIVVKDAAGNSITGLTNAAFNLALSLGTSAGTFGTVTASATPGTYTSTFTGTTAGTASTLTATVSGVALSTKPTVTVTPGTVSAANSTVSFATSSVASGGTDTVTIVVKDAAGNVITGLTNAAFNLALSGGTSAGTFGTVSASATPGTYTSTFTGTTAGTASTLTATVNAVVITTKPTVAVTPGTVSAGNSTVSFATSSVASGSGDTVTIVVKDAAGNAITGLANAAFSFALSVGTSAGTFGTVSTTATPGTYTATFTGTAAGTASTLTATVSGVALSTTPTVTVTPGSVSAGNSTVSFATSSVASGGTDTVTIVVKDAAGNAITGLTNAAFSFALSVGTSAGTFGTVTASATPGTYTSTFTATTSGTASTVTATVSGTALTTKPTVTVTPGSVSAANSTVSFAASSVASGGTDVVTIVVKDAAGNAITGLTNAAFSFALSVGTSAGTFGTVTASATPGTYTSTFTATTSGTASTLTATVSGTALTTKPTITVTPATVSATNSTVSFATSTVTSGGTDVVTIVVKDGSNNAITGLTNAAFAFSLAGGASSGTFGTVTASATPGTYTSTFTATTSGTASTLTATVSGTALTTKPTVTVTPGAVSAANSTVSFASSSVATGNTDAVTIVVKDAAGNAITGLANAAFTFGLSIGTSAGTFGTVSATATPGTYSATFTATTVGTASTLTATVSGVTLNTKPTVTVTAAPTISPTNSIVTSVSPIVGPGGTDTITIVVKDTTGNPVSGLSNGSFSFSLTGGTSSGTFGTVTETATPGTYTVAFSATTAGTVSTLNTTVGGVGLSTKPTIFVSNGLDVDGNGTVDPLTDGVLIIRYLFGFTGTTLTTGAVGAGATRTDPVAISSYLLGMRTTMLDADGNGTADPLTDGVLIMRYMFGFTGSTLISGAVNAGGTRTSAVVIQAYLDSYNPTLAHEWSESVGPGVASSELLTAPQLQAVTTEAIARWEAVGITADQKAKLLTAQVQLANLGGNVLGQTHANDVLIDESAAGYGWYVDSTASNSAFANQTGSNEWSAGAGSLAAGQIDLLTVVMHELGLVMGLQEFAPSALPNNIMTSVLPTGVRRLP